MSVGDAILEAAEQVGARTDDAILRGNRCPTFRRSDFRLRWLATRMHTFVFVVDLSTAAHVSIPVLADEARDWARDHKGGLPAGLQTGSTAMPVFIAPEVSDVAAWAEGGQHPKFGVGLFPVVVSSDGRQVHYRRKSQMIGIVYEPFRRSLASRLVAQVHADG
jgi:hypothetical protein